MIAPADPGAHRRRQRRSGGALSRKLHLHRLVLSWFGADALEELASFLRDECLEGLDADNVHLFHRALVQARPHLPSLPPSMLLAYDQRIVSVTMRLNGARMAWGAPPLVWKYFQYLALLFTEAYLERYFCDPAGLRAELEAAVRAAGLDEASSEVPDTGARAKQNKLAYWSATGSGKTLLMHANILQWQDHRACWRPGGTPLRILLLTPNEGLSRQHLRELRRSGIRAELFRREGGASSSRGAVRILDIHKLRDEMGDKTVAVDALGRDNLVLVDEGHRGTTGGERGAWLRHRNALCEEGFSFEYSATFGQAVKGSAALEDTYARSILFDYSYRYFHADGFGKDYRILNLAGGAEQEHVTTYLVACLLAFFEQQRVYRDRGQALRLFQIEKPLWVFVGGSVTAALSKREASDILDILSFFARYSADRADSVARIEDVLRGSLMRVAGEDAFGGSLDALRASGWSAQRVYDESLALVFHARGGGRLRLEKLDSAPGEIALVLGGENPPFGVVNVGDDEKLARLCEERGFGVARRVLADSLFDGIGDSRSPVNVLIGAKKFTEGWNSWRVSTMGLMHVGKGEGAQIIQLFGRGVRLKGVGTCLKRSRAVRLPEGLTRPPELDGLETLNIFGIHADYMAQFRAFLKEEGVAERVVRERVEAPASDAARLGGATGRWRGGIVLRRPDPDASTARLLEHPIRARWQPNVRMLTSCDDAGETSSGESEAQLGPRQLGFVDLDRLTFEVIRFKRERGWHELIVTPDAVAELLADPSWYRLVVPDAWLAPRRYDRVGAWSAVALSLLKRYAEAYYRLRRREIRGLRAQEAT